MSLIAEVAVAAPLDRCLSYLVPEDLSDAAKVGVRLKVPLGRRQVTGFLLSLREGDGEKLKAVAEVLDESPLFPADMVPFLRRIAEYYCYPIGEAIRTALPAGLSGRGSAAPILQETIYSAGPENGEPAGAKQRAILDHVRQAGEVSLSELRRLFDAPHAPLKRLVELGFLAERKQERLRDPFLDCPVPVDEDREATEDQSKALASIVDRLDAGGFAPLLLHGVTGSGKTEVYLRCIDHCLGLGLRALVLVPEIALTPQLVGRFRARFAGRANLAVLHSGLSGGERYDAWRCIARGDAEIIIGARSAIFAPIADLGIIVVDEEHEGSYKQSEGFRYNARDLALLRGQMQGATVLLGSATPSIQTYHRAISEQSGYLPLAGRVQDRPLPQVTLVDLKEEEHGEVLSAPLKEALEQTLAAGDQALLLLNRRGFAPFLLCSDCGTTFRCPNCEITLTYHQGQRQMRCHYCDFVQTPPEICPGCQGGNVLPEGAGTERLEEELCDLFPEARIARMDRDTTSHKGAHQQLVSRMMGGEIDILVGTQMVAKGHDFPNVTLVGVLNADSGLNFPDFRSAERTFSLLTQVAGRAGRGEKPGRVLVQTYSPDHYALQCVAGHDYRSFCDQEIEFRRELCYPPFGFLVNLVLAGNDPQTVSDASELLAAELIDLSVDVEVLGPTPCPLARLRGKTRMQILLKAEKRTDLRRTLTYLDRMRKKAPAGVSLAVDVDPVDML